MLEGINELPDRPKLLSPNIMAYIGDSLFELFIRTYLLEENVCKPGKLHQQAIEYVNAKAQARLLEKLRDELTKEEESIVRRGRNASSKAPKGTDQATYQYSTGFETLLGYLYLTESEDRLQELLGIIKKLYREE
jgi:ribonuclease-3 family protein